MHRSARQFVIPGAKRPRASWLWTALCIVAVLFVVACGDEGDSGVVEDRRFATDPEPAPTQAPLEATATSTETIAIPTVPRFTASPEASPVTIQSQIGSVFVLLNGRLEVIAVETGAHRTLADAGDFGEIALAVPNPDHTSIALISRPENRPSEFDLTVIDLNGTVQAQFANIEAMLGPGPGRNRGSLAADWDSKGSRVAIVFPEGGGVVISLDGGITLLTARSQAPAPMSIAWSPDDEAIAFTSRDFDDESPYLAIGGARVLPLDPVRIAGTGGSRPIHRIVWQPDGETLLAIQGSADQGDEYGGDLIQIDRRTLTARFALGASRFGPSAEIVSVVTDPNGTAWGIVTVAPGPSGGIEATVWGAIGEMTNVTRFELGEAPPVAGIVWTIAGITVTLLEGDAIRLVSFSPDGIPAPFASPEASPAPSASPHALAPIVETATPLATTDD